MARVRGVLGWLAITAGLLGLVGALLLPWGADDSTANPQDDLVVQVVCFLVLALASGIAFLARRASPVAGLGLTTPTAALGGLLALGEIGLLRDHTTSAPGPGWWTSFLAAACMVAVAVVSLTWRPLRSNLVRAEMRWTDPAVLVVIVATAVGVLVLLDYVIYIQQDSSLARFWVVWFWAWALVAAVLVAVGLVLGPLVAGRAWLIASGVVLLDRPLSSGLFASNHGTDTRYLALGVIAAIVLILTAPLVGRWPRPAPDAEAPRPTAQSSHPD